VTIIAPPFERALAFILEWEGGYSNDPKDPGGETRWGISKRSYPEINIATLTKEQAAAIYRRDYWDRCKCGDLPLGLGLAVFNAAVNQGPKSALKLLKATEGQSDRLLDFFARQLVRYGQTVNFEIYGRGWARRSLACYRTALQLGD